MYIGRMQEDFLHYLWRQKTLLKQPLKTTSSQEIEILSFGLHNHEAGPDFFNAKIRIDSQLWAGNVEMHLKSSDWYLHNHEQDAAYDNVILHVVWEDDVEVFRKDQSSIPCLELKNRVSPSTLAYYDQLFSKTSKWINCEKDIATFNAFIKRNWLERLYVERLERKSALITSLLVASHNNWEATLFKMLAKNFGLKVNGDAFLSIANSFDYAVFRKQHASVLSLEALLFGQGHLLKTYREDRYYQQLQNEFRFLCQKFDLTQFGCIQPSFFRLRPPNFPTIRLSQLANLYHKEQHLFSKLMSLDTLEAIYKLLDTEASLYWRSHYNFEKESKPRTKRLSQSFIDLLIVNTIIPLKFCYNKSRGISDTTGLFDLMMAIAPEKNAIISKFETLGLNVTSALESQAIIQLKNAYCDKNKCLQCTFGSALLNRNM